MRDVFTSLGFDDPRVTAKLIAAAVILAVAWGGLRLLVLLTATLVVGSLFISIAPLIAGLGVVGLAVGAELSPS